MPISEAAEMARPMHDIDTTAQCATKKTNVANRESQMNRKSHAKHHSLTISTSRSNLIQCHASDLQQGIYPWFLLAHLGKSLAQTLGQARLG